jgi:integrase/recombinase XerD
MLSTKATTLTSDSIAAFQSSLSARGRSEHTVKCYGSDLRMLLQDLNSTSIPQELFETTAMTWLQKHRQTIAPKTTNRRLTSLRAFARWAGWGNVLGDYSAPTPTRGNPHPLPEGIEGVKRLIAATDNEKQRALLALCGFCGLRVAEALAVRPSDFNLEQMTLKIRGKGDRERIVPVSSAAWEVLSIPVTRAFTEGNRPVVQLKDRFARRIITDLGVKAGLERSISSHDLRSTFATAVFDKTLDIRVTQELLGHASVETTQLYTQVTLGKMRAAVEL